jgi:hypothetical protein
MATATTIPSPGSDTPFYAQLPTIAATLECAPYLLPDEKQPTRLARAVGLVQAGKVEYDYLGSFTVQGSDRTYLCRAGGCECPASSKGKSKWCYHLVAACLWDRTQAACDASYRAVFDLHVPAAAPLPADERSDNDLPTEDDLAATPDELLGWQPEPEATEPHPLAAPTFTAIAQRAPHPVHTLRPISAIIHDLSQPLPDACVAQRTQQGQTIRYLHWWDVALLLDTYAPGWQGEIVRSEDFSREEIIDRRAGTLAMVQTCVITYRLSIPCIEGVVSRPATGRESSHEPIAFGDLSSNASAMAFTRAAAMFGVGVWLRDKDQTTAALRQHLLQRSYEQLALRCAQQGEDKESTQEQLLRHAGVTRRRDVPLWMVRQAVGYMGNEETIEGLYIPTAQQRPPDDADAYCQAAKQQSERIAAQIAAIREMDRKYSA